jgi:hypothetical protein
MLSDNLAPIISPHPGKVLPGAVLPVYPMLESLSRKSDGIEHGSVRRRNYTVLEPLRAISDGRRVQRVRRDCARLVRALITLSQYLLREGEC